MAKYEMLVFAQQRLRRGDENRRNRKFENIVKSMGGTVVSTDKWGTKKLSYPIKFKNDAYYVLMTFEADGTGRERARPHRGASTAKY